MAPDSPRITVSIVSHGQGSLVERLLRSLQSHETQFDYEVIVTENEPSTERIDRADWKFPLRTDRNPRPQGFAANTNQALQRARGEHYCILNPDLIFIEPVFEQLLNDIESDRADIVAPMILNPQGGVEDSARSVPSLTTLIIRRFMPSYGAVKSPSELPVHPDWLAGMFLLTSRATYWDLGGLDERYYMYFEDVDFGCRAWLAGYRLMLDKGVRVVHEARRSSHRDLRHFTWHLWSALKFLSSSINRGMKRRRTDSIG